VKKSWGALGGVVVLVCMAGCEGGAAAHASRSGGAYAATPTTTVTYAPAFQRAPDPTSEFLSAWRPKE
jgi:hypothetical protein